VVPVTPNPNELTVGKRTFRWGSKTYLMGILNVTPDSFSGDGLWSGGDAAAAVDRALAQAESFIAAGVDILDVGGESTRPGAAPLSVDEECRRVIPVVEAIARRFEIPISIDTYKAAVARQALEAGASLVNDVWGLRMDPKMAGVVAHYAVPVILMHNRSRPEDAAQSTTLGGRYVGVEYDDLLADVIRELRESISLATEAGVPERRIIIDPGIGFGKTVEQNLELLNRLPELRSLGKPVLVGPSRKSFIGYTLNVPPGERVWGTAAAVALCAARGADIVRVHDVAEMAQVCRMADAIVRRG
jgi:dihydropteroate synthase